MATKLIKNLDSLDEFTVLATALSDGDTDASDILEISGDWTTRDTSAAAANDSNIIIRTKAGDEARHAGFDNDGTNYALEVSGAHCLTVNNSGLLIDGLIIKQDGTGTSDEGVRMANDGGTFTAQNCIVWSDTQDSQQDGFYSGNIDVTMHIIQCFIQGFGRGGIHSQNTSGATDKFHNINSCGIRNCGHENNGGGIVSQFVSGDAQMKVHNTWACENDNGGSSTTTARDYKNQDDDDNNGTWTVNNCMDSDNSIAASFLLDFGGDNFPSRTLADVTAGGDEILVIDDDTAPYDLRLLDDDTNNDAQDAHTTDTDSGMTIPSTDIAGTSRPQNTSHDIGPFEISAAVAPAGVGAQILPKLTQAGVGIMQPDGAGDQDLAPAIQAGAGVETIPGAGDQDLAPATQSGVGVETIPGAGDQDLAPVVQEGTGIMQPDAAGAQDLAAAIQAGAGVETIPGAGDQDLAPAVQEGTGIMQPDAAGDQDLAPAIQAGAGVETIPGAGDQDLAPAVQEGTGTSQDEHTGVGDQDLAAAAQAGAGVEAIPGAGVQDLAAARQAGAGVEAIPGAGEQDLAPTIQAGTGVMQPVGVGAQILAVASQAGGGILALLGAGVQRLAALLQSGIGIVQAPGTGLARPLRIIGVKSELRIKGTRHVEIR